MFKKAMMLAALVAFAIPAAASADWQHNGGDLETDASITVTGQAKFQGQVGNVECQFISVAQLTAGTTTGHAQFDVDNEGAANDEADCSIGGGLVSLGCTDAEQVTVSGAFTAHGVSPTTIEVTTGTIQNHLTGGIFCPKTHQLTPGSVHITTGQHLFEQGELSGTLKLHSAAGEQQVTITGAGSVTPSGTYGVSA